MSVSLSIKDVPEETVERLRDRAKRHHRSLQGELLAILDETLSQRKLSVDEVFEQARGLGLKRGPASVDLVRRDRDGR
jgi:antitoxin FitA